MILRHFFIALTLLILPGCINAQVYTDTNSIYYRYDSIKKPLDYYNIVHKNKAWRLIDKDGRPSMPDTFSNMEYTLEFDQFAARFANGLWGVIDTTGHILCPALFDTIIQWQRGGPNVAMKKRYSHAHR